MKILLVTQYFWPESFRVNDLVEGLIARGHEVTVLTGLPNYPAGRLFKGYTVAGPYVEEFRGARVIRVPLIPRGDGGALRLAANYLSFVLSASIAVWLRKWRGDAIFVYEPSPFTVGIPAIVLKKRIKRPIVFWVQDLWPESLSATGAVRSPKIVTLVARMVRWIYGKCDRILVQSRAFVEPAIAAGAECERIDYLPNWAEPLFLRDVPESAERGRIPAERRFRVMFAGNLGEAQSLETLVEAAKLLKACAPIEWVVLGDGRREAWLKRRIVEESLEAHVTMLGRRPVTEMPAYFSKADVMLVTLKREPIFAYTIPSKVQSYMACAKPIVGALDGEGARIVNESGCGIAVGADDARALAAAVEAMYHKAPAELREMGNRGRNYYNRNFHREVLLARLESIIEQVVEEAGCEY